VKFPQTVYTISCPQTFGMHDYRQQYYTNTRMDKLKTWCGGRDIEMSDNYIRVLTMAVNFFENI